ncbi:MAG: hypothetical protein RIB63_21990, partial [Fulvivirga sp.]
VVNLNDLTGLPKSLIQELSYFNEEFKSTDFLEHLEENWELGELIIKIDEFCMENEVIGFHYTRALPEDILARGLLARSGQDIRTEFLEKHGPLFSQSEIHQIKDAWDRTFDDHDREYRDYHVFFNFTLTALNRNGSELLLENYGGEQIYWPLYEMEGIKNKIVSIGTPLIVKCRLNPNGLSTLIQYPWGKIATSTYHRTQNPKAYQTDQDGYQRTTVPPNKIELIKLEELNSNG